MRSLYIVDVRCNKRGTGEMEGFIVSCVLSKLQENFGLGIKDRNRSQGNWDQRE